MTEGDAPFILNDCDVYFSCFSNATRDLIVSKQERGTKARSLVTKKGWDVRDSRPISLQSWETRLV